MRYTVEKSVELQGKRWSRRDACGRFSFRAALAEHFSKKGFGIDAMRCIVGAGVDATWFFQVRAEIAGSGFLLDDRFLAAGIFGIVGKNFKRMQIDVAIRAVARAEAAADAPILDDDLE